MGEGISLPEPVQVPNALDSGATANGAQTEAERAAQIAAQAEADRSLKLRVIDTAFKEAARHVTNFSQLEELRKKANAEIAESGEDGAALENWLNSTLEIAEKKLIESTTNAIISTIDDSINLTDLTSRYSRDNIYTMVQNAGVPEGRTFVEIQERVENSVSQKKDMLIDDSLTNAKFHVVDTILESGLNGLKKLDSTALLIEKGLTPELARIHAPRFKEYIEIKRKDLIAKEITTAKEKKAAGATKNDLIPFFLTAGMTNEETRSALSELGYF